MAPIVFFASLVFERRRTEAFFDFRFRLDRTGTGLRRRQLGQRREPLDDVRLVRVERRRVHAQGEAALIDLYLSNRYETVVFPARPPFEAESPRVLLDNNASNTHTVVEDPRDPANVYIYVSGSAPVRAPQELAGRHGPARAHAGLAAAARP